jgi:hypothetical protein
LKRKFTCRDSKTLDSNAAERLVHIRGRHIQGTEIALRFRQETLDHEHILEGVQHPIIHCYCNCKQRLDRKRSARKKYLNQQELAGPPRTAKSIASTAAGLWSSWLSATTRLRR